MITRDSVFSTVSMEQLPYHLKEWANKNVASSNPLVFINSTHGIEDPLKVNNGNIVAEESRSFSPQQYWDMLSKVGSFALSKIHAFVFTQCYAKWFTEFVGELAPNLNIIGLSYDTTQTTGVKGGGRTHVQLADYLLLEYFGTTGNIQYQFV